MADWIKLGDVDPRALPPARLILHWAAQLPSAVGTTLAPAKEDFSHTALVWDSGTLAGVAVDPEWAALRLADLGPLARGKELALADKTMDDALAWLGKQFGKKVERPTHEMPEHELGKGASFPAAARAAYGELANWFGN